MHPNETKKGYLAAMPPRLKSRLLSLALFYLVTGYFALTGEPWGMVLSALPFVFWVIRIGLQTVAGHTKRRGLVDYTIDYLWASSVYVRSFVVALILASVLGGLGWIGTEDLRAERAEPTFGERLSGMAGAAVEKGRTLAGDAAEKTGAAAEAAQTKASGWIDNAKGWFD